MLWNRTFQPNTGKRCNEVFFQSNRSKIKFSPLHGKFWIAIWLSYQKTYAAAFWSPMVSGFRIDLLLASPNTLSSVAVDDVMGR